MLAFCPCVRTPKIWKRLQILIEARWVFVIIETAGRSNHHVVVGVSMPPQFLSWARKSTVKGAPAPAVDRCETKVSVALRHAMR